MSPEFEIENIADSNVDDTKETLVAALKLALVEDLHSNHRRVLHHTVRWSVISKLKKRSYISRSQVEALIPIRIQSLLDDTGRVGLFRVNGDNCKGIRKSEDIALGQPIGRNN